MKKVIFSLFILLLVWGSLDHQDHRVVAYQTDNCINFLLNGGMENDAGWHLTSGSLPSQYSSTAYTGNQGLLLGPPPSINPNMEQTFSTAWQVVTLPEDATTLTFWYLPQTGSIMDADRQYAGLVDLQGETITLFLSNRDSADSWQSYTADVSMYRGETLGVYFGVRNDGLGNTTRMYVDEITLCSETAIIPPSLPSATPDISSDTLPPAPALPSATPDISSDTLPPVPTLPSPTPDISSITLPPVLTIFDTEKDYTLSELGFEDELISGPFGSASYPLGLPPNWELLDGVNLTLHLTTLRLETNTTQPTNPILEVLFNNVLISTVVLQSGEEQFLELPIPPTALAAREPDDRHELKLRIDDNNDCQEFHKLLVHADSLITLPHSIVSPLIDFQFFPSPFYHKSFLPETAVIVIPDQPTTTNLQAAFTVAAGLGELSRNNMSILLMPMAQVTTAVRETDTLIFVGLPDTLPLLNEVAWPAPLNDGQFAIAEARTDDGILQLTVSPWNPATAVLLVTGQSDEGLLKAAQAVSHGTIRPGPRPDVAIITSIEPFLPSASDPTISNRRLSDLGYLDLELKGRGRQNAEFEFTIPSGYIIGDEAYIDLIFSHSSLLNLEQSGLVVRLNNRSIGSARFDDDDSTNLKQTRIILPRSTVHTGVNHLHVRAELTPLSRCTDPNFDSAWLTLWADSRLSLSLLPITGGVRPTLNLDNFPFPFDNQLTLRDVTIVVPADDPAAWNTAAQVAFNLGDRSDSPIVLLQTAFADEFNEETRQNEHLIVVGQPQNPTLALRDADGDASTLHRWFQPSR